MPPQCHKPVGQKLFFYNGERAGLAALKPSPPASQEVGTSPARLIPLKSLWLTPLPLPQLDSVTLSPAPER